MLVTIIILVLSAIFFMIGKIRSDLIALCSLILLVLFDILTPAEALSGFSNSVVIMMVGLFVVGGAIFQTGLAKMVSGKIMRTAGKNQFLLFILVMLVTSFVGAFVSNTGTVALMLPIVVSLANSADMSPSRLLMPLAFASSMGGMLTLIGTPPNLVIQEAIVDAGLEPLSFFSFTPVGLVCIAVGIIVLIPLSKWILSRKKRQAEDEKKSHPSMAELLREYQLEQRLFRVQVPADSTYCGKMLQELDISEKYGVGILEIRRKISTRRHFFNNIYDHITAGPHTVIQSGDILYLSGDAEHVSRMIGDNALWKLDTIYNTSESDKMNQTGVAEVLLLHNSSLHNVAVRDCGFREKFNINILGIQRNDTYYVHDLRDFRMHSGDALLIQGEWSDIARMSREQNDWVVLGQPIEQVAKVTIDRKAPVAYDISDDFRLGSGGDGGYHSSCIDGIYRVLAKCRGCLSYDKLGKHRTDCRHDAYVVGFGENRGFVRNIYGSCFGTRRVWSISIVGRNLFYDIIDDNVYQQYSYGGAFGSHCHAIGSQSGCESLSLSFCRNRSGEYVFCFTFLYTA